MEKIKIFYLVDTISGPNGGTERQILELINSLNPDRFQMTLGCLFNSPWLKRNLPPGPVLMLNFKGYWHPNFLWNFFKLVKFIKTEKVQILQTFFLEANIIGVLAGRIAGVPYIIASRRNSRYLYNQIRAIILKVLRGSTHLYLANSQSLAEFVVQHEKVSAEKVRVIYNGVDTSKFSPAGEDRKSNLGFPAAKRIVGVVANLKKIKGIDCFIEAARTLSAKRNDFLFIIIGGEYDEEKYKQKIERLNLSNLVWIMGVKENIQDYLKCFEIGVNASLTEGFSNSVLEYMAAGLPVVATRVGGNSEQVVDGQTGFLVESENAQQLADKINLLLENAPLRKELGLAGRKRIENLFSKQKFLSNIEAFYEEIINKDKIVGRGAWSK